MRLNSNLPHRPSIAHRIATALAANCALVFTTYGCSQHQPTPVGAGDGDEESTGLYGGTSNSVVFADSPFPRNQPTLTKLACWNNKLVAEGDGVFFEILCKDEIAQVLLYPTLGHLQYLASGWTKGDLALCSRRSERCLFSILQDRLERIELPKVVESTCDQCILVTDRDDVLIATPSSCIFYKKEAWVEVGGWSAQRIGKASSPYEGVLNWPPDHVLLANGVLYLGTDEGEFGGMLLAFDTSTGSWTNVQEKWDAHHEPVTAIRRSPVGEIWVTTGIAHLGLFEGDLRVLRMGQWILVARSTDPASQNVNWQAPPCDFRSVAFDDSGRQYVLTGLRGVFRSGDFSWESVTPGWPGFVYCTDLTVLPSGQFVVATYDAGVLIGTPGIPTVKRLPLGKWPKWKD